jgi:hypothetical protein
MIRAATAGDDRTAGRGGVAGAVPARRPGLPARGTHST